MADVRFKDQNYDKLLKRHRELGVPWTDPTFPADETSIGLKKARDLPRGLEWKRPSDLVKNPRLFIDGASSRDATQGRIGNCWFVAACGVLAGSKPLWERIIPDWKDQVLFSSIEAVSLPLQLLIIRLPIIDKSFPSFLFDEKARFLHQIMTYSFYRDS